MITRWLKRILKYTLLLILVVIIGIVSWLSYYYVTEVRPYKPIIEDILSNADPENRNPPANVVAMIDTEFYCESNFLFNTIAGTPSYCKPKTHYISRLIPDIKERRTLARSFNDLMLSETLLDSLSDNDKNALIADLAYAGYEKPGFNHFSKAHFGKPLSELSIEESAVVIAVLRGPSYYLKQPERLKERTQYLLDKYHNIQSD